jgi:hypothetical protein
MAKATIIATNGEYLTVLVEFADQVFEQVVVTDKTGDTLEAQLQGYANDYEAAWLFTQSHPPSED